MVPYPPDSFGGERRCVGRLAGHQVHRAADRVAVHVGGDRLRHLDGLEHVHRHRIERDLAGLAFGRGDFVAVEGDLGVGRGAAADLDVATLALVPRHGYAGKPLHRLGRRGVGEAAHLVGGHHVGDVGGVLLPVERLGLVLGHDPEDLHLGELDHRDGELKVHSRQRPSGRADLARLRLPSDVGHVHRIHPRSHPGKDESPLGVGDGGEAGAPQVDPGPVERAAGLRLDHLAADVAASLPRGFADRRRQPADGEREQSGGERSGRR